MNWNNLRPECILFICSDLSCGGCSIVCHPCRRLEFTRRASEILARQARGPVLRLWWRSLIGVASWKLTLASLPSSFNKTNPQIAPSRRISSAAACNHGGERLALLTYFAVFVHRTCQYCGHCKVPRCDNRGCHHMLLSSHD